MDIKKYEDIYNELESLSSDETLELYTKSDSKDVQDFYYMIETYFLQKRQKFAIEHNLF